MSFPKLLIIIAVLLFGTVVVAAVVKNWKTPSQTPEKISTPPEPQTDKTPSIIHKAVPKPLSVAKPLAKPANTLPTPPAPPAPSIDRQRAELPDANRIEEFFQTKGPKLPIVETMSYKSRVAWQKGRPAWLSDYASHYQTSRHFIARSLNGEPDYLKQEIAEGDHFNVLRQDKNFQFHLVIDLSRCRLWFYYDDLDTHERVLLKTYQIGVGRIDATKASGFLTPIGTYTLGNKIAIYKPKMMGYYSGEQVEMMTIFGTRWIPFDKEVSKSTAPAKGFGLHGLPWTRDAKGELAQDRTSLGKYESDGCVRLASEDIEELFSIIITRPTTVELVKDFYEAAPPFQHLEK